MKIVIRMDDIAPGMDMGKFRRFKRLLDEHHVQPLIGVVPDNRDKGLEIEDDERVADRREKNIPVEFDRRKADRRDNIDNTGIKEDNPGFWRMVRNLQSEGWLIAMHGLHHEYTTKSGGILPLNRKSEFAGLPTEKQKEMIAEGKKILAGHGIATDFFMAPSHSYDRGTIEALLENGFRRITDGFGRNAYRRFDVTFYPISFRRDSVIKDKNEGYTTFVVHTNTLTNEDFAYYEKVFSECDVVSWNEWLMADAVEAGAFQGVKEFVMASAKYYLVRLKKGK